MTISSLIVVRHGRTAYNEKGLLQGRTDNPLDDVGREQADRVARYLTSTRGSAPLIIASPLIRARETAEAIARSVGASVEIDERWIELDYGVYEGVPHTDVLADIWAKWRRDPDYAPDGGESLAAVYDRVAGACDELSDRLAGRCAIVVTHVSPIKSSVAWALGVDIGIGWRTQLDNASVSRIDLTPRGPVLRSFNEIAP